MYVYSADKLKGVIKMSMNEYAVYGITEPGTNKIVFIGYYIYD